MLLQSLQSPSVPSLLHRVQPSNSSMHGPLPGPDLRAACHGVQCAPRLGQLSSARSLRKAKQGLLCQTTCVEVGINEEHSGL